MPRYENVREAYDALSARGDQNPDSHLWLYAKHHYIKRDVWAEMKWLIGVRNLIDPQYVKDGDVLMVLGHLVLPLLHHRALEDFLNRLSPSHVWHFTLRNNPLDTTPERYEDRLLGGYLSIMYMAKVWDGETVMLQLDLPDPMLLPTKSVCPNGGEHEEGTDGAHSNLFCKKCFQSLE